MTNRKNVKAEFNKNRNKDIQELADIEVENRTSKHVDELNRYGKALKEKKEEKWEREHAKRGKMHLGKRKHIEKRAIAEAEEQQA